MLQESLKILMCCRVVRATLRGDAKLYVIFILRFKLLKKLYNLAELMLNHHIDTGLYRIIYISFINFDLYSL